MQKDLQLFKAEFFKALGHPLRIQILEQLCEGDKNVNELQALIGSEGSACSQQLMVLRSNNIVYGRKEGNRVIYSLRDPMIKDLLAVARQIFHNHLVDTLNEIDRLKKDISTEG
ncbi:ArsR/SmtB family transcription factor [Halalkalibacter oceani]|uniref:Metalloregulator ArsR/SmtB family transcription factor n=1 Tax=Halalkalibacter oceani TaxID=1653776 RepID=A0A9X2DRJ8_9BACI|nr:metalloregulator ArsR/SmtB family transcription factor [Halalkalibacter oceani]MCM3714132.1 metalloregulator ArsR/SmtB family transcription factor [Halalkalibacter oceani]